MFAGNTSIRTSFSSERRACLSFLIIRACFKVLFPYDCPGINLIMSDLLLLQHFSNAGFPCPIMQSPSDHFLRAINTDFDRIIAMCKNWQVLIMIMAVLLLVR